MPGDYHKRLKKQENKVVKVVKRAVKDAQPVKVKDPEKPKDGDKK